MHQVTYCLAYHLSIESITFTEIYGGYGYCSREFRRFEIKTKRIKYYELASLIPKKDNQYDKFIKPGLEDRKRVPVVCANQKGYKEIDSTSGGYLVLIARRTESADALAPHGDKQYKYSLSLESGHPVHTNSTGKN
ncbi:hypothetical protein RclHR1_03220007 [Rhizophagus clarus]|nr:hypothetical protein RclHR1_03220007 [Rhizophagus clarus]